MTVATLIVHDGPSKGKAVESFTMSAPHEVKQFLERKTEEHGCVINWNEGKFGVGCIRGRDHSSVDGTGSRIELYQVLSWIEECFGPIVSVTNDGENYGKFFLFRRQH